MHGILYILVLFIITVVINVNCSDNSSERFARQLLYYKGTEVELNFVLAVPLKTGQHTVTLGFFLEANYDLPPYNSQSIYIQPLQILEDRLRNPVNRAKRNNINMHRAALYRAIEILIESNMDETSGKQCLLRSICEASSSPLHNNGIFEEFLHVILTPSSTEENGPLHLDYLAAEEIGNTQGLEGCKILFSSCRIPPLDLFSTVQKIWHPP